MEKGRIMIDHEPQEINPNTIKKTGKVFNDDCTQHVICHCICHTGGANHCFPCCRKCPYCHQNVIYTGNVKTNS